MIIKLFPEIIFNLMKFYILIYFIREKDVRAQPGPLHESEDIPMYVHSKVSDYITAQLGLNDK